ncbi:hypothetical protein [Actinopolymorpha pittospori]|uniref:Uncharacterized protein n=1 Tax=Actinopolymorpha pittospori TaxID=648752 RepID=A0A927N9L2_9ACTN|nr:hypothetical protein [Actinopolymorpha pittospori]MBE1611487.1 hypothetical protein [Actinopolymorpha pittospori]
MATALKDIRDVLSELWIWLIVLLIAFVAWAIVCIAIAFPGGWGFVKFLEVTGAFLAAVAIAVVNARNTLNQAQGAIDTLQDVDTDTPGFPGGKWPRPGVALNDGSVTDGDASDWRVKR